MIISTLRVHSLDIHEDVSVHQCLVMTDSFNLPVSLAFIQCYFHVTEVKNK